MRRRALLGVLACALAPAGLAAPPVPSGDVHACVRLAGLSRPLDVAARLEPGLARAARRERLVSMLQADVETVAGPVRSVLAANGARELVVVWSAGVVCGTGPRAAFEFAQRLPAVAATFDDPPRSDGELGDGAHDPNRNVPPEPPLVSLHVPEAWDRGYTGKGVVVALIDTGIDATHPDLAAQLWTNPREIAGNGIDDDGNGYVDDIHGWNFSGNNNDVSDAAGHGTNAAGLLVGNGASGAQTGIAPGAMLMMLRRGTTEQAMWQASQYALANGADVISQSVSWKWSFVPDYASWRRQAESELAFGVLHVNSAGNNGTDTVNEPVPYNVAAPANCPPPWLPPDQNPVGGVSSMVAVGDVDSLSLAIAPLSSIGPAEWTDIRAHRSATYPYDMPSNYRDYPDWGGANGLLKPDLVTPGENSKTTKLGGGYTTFGGTSASAPRVAALALLMLEAVPQSTPAELYRAMVTTSRDLGPAGRDNQYGAGLPNAVAAIDALGPPLDVTAVQLIDPGAPEADGDGTPEAGEIDRLSVTVRNTSAATLGPLELLLTASDANAIVRDGYARIETLAPGASATIASPWFGVEFAAGSCARRASLRLELRTLSGSRFEPVFVTIGTETRTALIDATFDADAGFAVSGPPTTGAWVRALPVGTTRNGQPANPGADGSDVGSMCYVTGNGSTDPDAADVDGGRATLTSPAKDARGFARVELDYDRWFFTSSLAGEDRFIAEASGDGTSWTTIDTVAAPENAWRSMHVVLSDLVTPGSGTRVRFSAEDASPDTTVEGGVDHVVLSGISIACVPWTAPALPLPTAVGASLRLSRVTRDVLRLTWAPPSASGGIDPPSGYTVRTSALAKGPFAEAARPAVTTWYEVGAAALAPGSGRFYLVESIGVAGGP